MEIKKIALLNFAKIILLTIIGVSFFPFHLSARETIRIGVLAHCGIERCLKRWEPTTVFLNNQLEDYQFTIKPLTFDEIYSAVESEEVEFILVNPAYYATIESRYGAQRIATVKHQDCLGQTCKTFFGGVIFCRSGREDIKTLQQIVGKRFMAVHKNSFGGWQMAWRKLMENGIDPVNDCSSMEFGLTHDAVVKAVQEGRVDVGTVRTGTLERMSREGTIKLDNFQVLGQLPVIPGFASLHSTRLYPEWPLAKLAHTDDRLAEKVVATLLTFGDVEKKEKNLTGYSWTIPQNYQTVHECLKMLRITPYEHYGEITFKAIFRTHWLNFLGFFIFIVVAFVTFVYIQRLRVSKQAQVALQQSRDFLQTVIDANPDPIVVISHDYKIILSNRAAHKIAVDRRDELLDSGLKCYEYFHNRKHLCLRDDFQCPLSLKKADYTVQLIERSYCDTNGNEQNYEIAIAPILDETGERLGIVESFRDISKRKKAEKSRQRLERAVEQSGETIVITDSEGTIQYVNPAFTQITGYSCEEAVGQNPRVLQSGRHDREFYQSMWKTLLSGETWQGEFINRKKNGGVYYEEATISPILGDDNQITNFIAVKRDVTLLKKSQQALIESEEYHRNLFNDSPTPLFLQDFSLLADRVQELKAGGVDNLTDYLKQNPDKVKMLAELVKTLQMNKAAIQLYNMDSSEMLQDALSRVLISGKSQHFIDQIEVFTNGKDWYEGEGVNQDSDGNALYIVIKKVVINRSKNGLSKVLVAINDVTKLHDMFKLKNNLEEQLVQSQKMEAIGTLAGGIAHDFNNILTSILGFSELTLLDLPDGSKAQKNIAQVLVSGRRATDLVKQILTFSRKEPQNIKVLNPHIVVKEVLKMLRSSLPTTIKIEEDIDPECGEVEANETQLHQIVMNLCTNAFQAMEDQKGTLKVTLQLVEINAKEVPGELTTSTGSFVVLSVSDTGCGMDRITKERIFDPYFTTKETGKGTGLGLAVIHGIVESYKGFIKVESEPGQGATFKIYIPALEKNIVTALSEIEKNQLLTTGTEHIVVVDDEDAILKLHEILFQRLGYKVTSTTDSQEALAEISIHPDRFDLLITDQSMPHLSGVELAREVLKLKPTMPIILCTGFSSIISEKDALAIGIKKYLKKPVELKELARIVRQVLDES